MPSTQRRIVLWYGLLSAFFGESETWRHLSRRVNCRAIAGLGDRKTLLPRNLKPTLDRVADIGDSLLARIAMRRTRPQIGDIGDPAFVLAGPEQVDVVMGLVHSSIYRP
ncbi:protein of unknown function [uncultured Sphingopyxis sp.]|uniref:Uncharacterized protein n=1 Tax=uncultured Sphingopyxis sp. TaxID=310581 RepID=A0A1Y5PUB1_9SPHN|nr:protein of unknown function [uncultured Sphingopyxis sp.]